MTYTAPLQCWCQGVSESHEWNPEGVCPPARVFLSDAVGRRHDIDVPNAAVLAIKLYVAYREYMAPYEPDLPLFGQLPVVKQEWWRDKATTLVEHDVKGPEPSEGFVVSSTYASEEAITPREHLSDGSVQSECGHQQTPPTVKETGGGETTIIVRRCRRCLRELYWSVDHWKRI